MVLLVPGSSTHPATLAGGFTLVELVVAVVILSVGVLGLAATAAVVARHVAGGGQQTLAAHLAQARLEVVASEPCRAGAFGPVSTRGVVERWTVTPDAPARARTARLVHAMTFRVDSRTTRTVVDTSTVLCR